ncbi:hypothetical protein ANCCAN_00562 [Ancylostoma caninum]|uniref:Uncharacterized protein n=1 Tax=Ancylostoma caninum TaxID=29170 RepID=A0A368HAD2_ANCCA|nr:hypothetical protein ANCCAN_00562 [Ancylostoma caninum]
MWAVFLVTVLCSAPPDASLEIVIDNQGSECMVDKQYREAIDKFHNRLRQRFAEGEGEGYGPAREMYGLVYDRGLERKLTMKQGCPDTLIYIVVELPAFLDLKMEKTLKEENLATKTRIAPTTKARRASGTCVILSSKIILAPPQSLPLEINP